MADLDPTCAHQLITKFVGFCGIVFFVGGGVERCPFIDDGLKIGSVIDVITGNIKIQNVFMAKDL